jgi:hypothetical protein
MTEETPSAEETAPSCSLQGRELQERLGEIAALAAESLLGQEADGARQVLRFRSDPETCRRLEALVAAEAECCSFLDLRLEAGGEETVLTVLAPAG